MPATALVVAVAGAVALARGSSFLGAALMAAGGLELVLWAWLRWDALVRAIVPTDAPEPLDRAVITAALVVGLGSARQQEAFGSSRPVDPSLRRCRRDPEVALQELGQLIGVQLAGVGVDDLA